MITTIREEDRYLLSNGAETNVVNHDLGLEFQGHEFEMRISQKRIELTENP